MLRQFEILDGMIEMKTIDKQTEVKQNGQKTVIPSCSEQTVPNMQSILEKYEGETPYYVFSDVLEVNNNLCELKSLEKHIAHRIIEDTIIHAFPLLEWISNDEDTAITIQMHADLDRQSLNITVGLEGDIHVDLLEITLNDTGNATTFV